jgi:hypothetical protein
MSVYPAVCLSICLIYMCIHLYDSLSALPSIYPLIGLTVHKPPGLSVLRLNICLSSCLFLCLSIYQLFYLPLYMFICQSFNRSGHLFVCHFCFYLSAYSFFCLYVCMQVHLSEVYLFACPCNLLSVHPSVCLFICPCYCLFIHLHVRLPFHLSDCQTICSSVHRSDCYCLSIYLICLFF